MKKLIGSSIIFDDKKKSIEIKGHFDPYVCGMVSTIKKLVLEGVIKGTLLIAETKKPWIKMIFKKEQDYKIIKKQIIKKWKEYEDI